MRTEEEKEGEGEEGEGDRDGGEKGEACWWWAGGGLVRRRLFGVLVFVVLVFVPAGSAAGSGFGLRGFEVSETERPTPEQQGKHELGSADVQAGSHPYALTTSFVLNEPEDKSVGGKPTFVVSEGLKDVRVALPPGFVGNPGAVPTCSYHDFLGNLCPDDTAVGEVTVGIVEGSGYKSEKLHKVLAELQTVTNPLYNVEPPGGVPAELGVMVLKTHPVLLDASVRTGGDYGITITSPNITEAVVTQTVRVTVWGVPADASHDRVRGKCLAQANSFRQEEEGGVPHNEEESQRENEERAGVKDPLAPVSCPVSIPARPFLTNPTSCGEQREVGLSVDGWNQPGNFVTGEHVISLPAMLPALSGCEHLDFSPTINVQPDTGAGSSPTGLNVDVHVPQESMSNPVGLGEADMRNTTVVLPAGVQISPAAADGLQACSLGEIGLHNADRPSCPDASKVATVRAKTPALEHELEGAIYLADQQSFEAPLENPFGSLIAMYLVVEEPETGVLVKLAGKVTPNPATGQLTTTFENVPQFPVSEIKLEFFGTARAPLATPALCGTYTTTTTFQPWSAKEPVDPSELANPSSNFQVVSGPGGRPCSDPLPFAPSLTAGSANIQAGAFSSLAMTMSREDGNQQLQSVQLHLPPGLSAMLSSVTPCGEPQADEGMCGPASLVGETTVSVGLGGDPFTVTGGKVYITGPYHGAPYGLSIVNPAKAGPFDLEDTSEHHPACDCLRVRAKIEINPITAAVTAVANSGAEGFAIPTMLEGIPLQIKHVNVTINRPGFTFNPTNCNPLTINGNLSSAEGATASLPVPFQVTNCAALAFKPSFTASTAARNTRVDGASLVTKVTYPSAPQGTEANIAKVKVSLPVKLPARLSTLQKACPEKTFAEDPASCPAAARVGEATTKTPVLPTPLSGPAYFVSHGAAKYPELIIVLQGDNVTIDLHGETAISKKGVLTSTFNTVPDAPFSTFELSLPEGRYSALTANGANLCKTGSLMIPTELLAQNGAVIKQNTKIQVTGCPKHKTKLKQKTLKATKKRNHNK